MHIRFLMTVCLFSAPVLATGSGEKAVIHATGTLTPRDGEHMSVQDITIKGKTEFFVYEKPTDKGIKQDKTEIQTVDDRVNKKIYITDKPIKTGPVKLRKGFNLTVPEPHTDYIFQDTIERIKTVDGVTKKELRPGATTKYTEVILDGTHYLMKKDTTVQATNIKTGLGVTVDKISRLSDITVTDTVTVEPEKKDTKKK